MLITPSPVSISPFHGSGSHSIEAYARLKRSGDVVGDGFWNASASLGKGTLSAWETHGAVTI